MELEDCDDILQDFKGGTLALNPEECKSPNSEHTLLISKEDIVNDTNKNKHNDGWGNAIVSIPQRISNKVFPKKNEEENTNKSIKPAMSVLIEGNASDFFTFRQSIIEQAVKECSEFLVDKLKYEPLWAAFLLTEISLWDTEKERLVLVSPKHMVVVKYDFIALRRLEHKIIPLDNIDTILIGDLVYPTSSIVPNRNMKGIRIMWNKGKPLNFGNKWNPLSNEVPLITFTSHPLFFHKECTNDDQKRVYNLDVFNEIILSSLSDSGSNYIIQHKNILMENYVGIGSLIHNRNGLGFFKVRGRFSF